MKLPVANFSREAAAMQRISALAHYHRVLKWLTILRLDMSNRFEPANSRSIQAAAYDSGLA
jgi:hypothetical protein